MSEPVVTEPTAARQRVLLPAVLVFTMTASSYQIFAFAVLAVDIIDDLSISRTALGLLGALNTLVGAVSAPATGRITDRIGARLATVIVLTISGLGMAMMALSSNWVLLAASAIVSGVPQGWGNPTTNALIAERVPQQVRGTVTGIKQSGVQFGVFLSGLTLPGLALAFGWRGAIVGYAVAFAVGGVAVGIAVVQANLAERERQDKEVAADRDEGDIIFRSGGEFFYGNEFNRRFWQLGILLIVVALGGIAPAVAMYYGTDLQHWVHFSGKLTVEPGQEGRVISRVIQITYLVVLSLFPALMFFQFDRLRVGTIRGRWVRSIFRLDRRTRSLADINARYGDELAEASHYSTDTVRFLGGPRSPLIVATILVTLGWMLLVLRTESFDFLAATTAESFAEVAEQRAESAEDLAEQAAQPDNEVATAAAVSEAEAAWAAQERVEAEAQAESEQRSNAIGSPATPPTTTGTTQPTPTTEPVDTDDAREDEATTAAAEARRAAEQAERDRESISSTTFFQLLNPRPSAAAMAFLGAYFYAVYLVLRGYFRGDLRPKVYNQITARLVIVVVVAYLLSVTLPVEPTDRTLWITAFFAGLTPRTVLRRMGELVPQMPLARTVLGWGQDEGLEERLPLTDIQGIDLWERDRLASEGITDIEALAHTNIIDTMISARLDIERLIDWVDQSLLVLHLPQAENGCDAIRNLRQIGIRRATTLVEIANSSDNEMIETVQSQLCDQPLAILTTAITRESNYTILDHWYTSPLGETNADTVCYLGADCEPHSLPRSPCG